MACEILIFTHSDYQDIWPIVVDGLRKNALEAVVHFAVNSSADTSNLPGVKYTYDESKPYASRLCEVLEKIQAEYVLFFHDVDILIDFDKERFSTLLEWIVQEKIDRFYLGVFGSNRLVKKLGDLPIGISGKNVCEWFTTPYDVGPSVWNKKTFLELMTQFNQETYRSIESSGIQEALLHKKIYGFCKVDIPVCFTVGRPFTEWFSFCHILVRGQWIPHEAFQSYSDFFLEIPEKYKIDIGKRGVAEFYHGMTAGFRIS